MPSVACDVDGTISENAQLFNQILTALHDAGWTVVILSGASTTSPSGGTFQSKSAWLKENGVTDCWDTLVVCLGDVPNQKAQYVKDNAISLVIDNSKANVTAVEAQTHALALMPWDSRVKGE